MTLTEYENLYNGVTTIEQLQAIQRPNSGEVVLQDHEVKIVQRMKRKYVFSYTIVYIPSLQISYMIVDGSNILKTTDPDGNPKENSVFSYQVPKEILT